MRLFFSLLVFLFSSSSYSSSSSQVPPSLVSLLAIFLGFVLVVSLSLFAYNKKIGFKLKHLLVGGVMSLLISASAGLYYGITAIEEMGESVDEINDHLSPLSISMSLISEHILQSELHLERYMREGDESEKDLTIKLNNKINQEIQEALKLAMKYDEEDSSMASKDILLVIKDISDKFNAYEKACASILKGEASADKKACVNAGKLGEEALSLASEKINLYTKEAIANAKYIEIKDDRKMIAASVSIVIFGLFILSMIYKASVGLIAKVSEAASSLSSSADSVSSSSVQFKANSEKLAAMTQEQAAGVQEIMSTLDELAAMASRNSEQAEGATDAASICKKEANSGIKSVILAKNAMNDISENSNDVKNQVSESNTKMRGISSIIDDISKKTKVINDIVFQTKLLSFNASVEAARAGEHGKGFAVVAEEVGKLAAMSGASAKEIDAMLASSISTVNNIVKESGDKIDSLLRSSMDKIIRGEEAIMSCEETFNRVVSEIERVDLMMKEISLATKEQSDGIDAIGVALREIDTGTNEVAGVSQEAASASEELSKEAESLTFNSSALTKLVSA